MSVNSIEQSHRSTAKFIQETAFSVIKMMVNQLLFPQYISHNNLDEPSNIQLLGPLGVSQQHFPQSQFPRLSQEQMAQGLERLFKKGTGRNLMDVVGETLQYNRDYHQPAQPDQQVQQEKSHHGLTKMMQEILAQALSNTAKNIEITLLKANDIPDDLISRRIAEHYRAQSGVSLQIEDLMKRLFNIHINNNNAQNVNENLNSNPNIRLYKHQIQRHLQAVLDGASLSAMRHVMRTVTENPYLESFTHYKKLQHDKSRIEVQPRVQTLDKVGASRVGI